MSVVTGEVSYRHAHAENAATRGFPLLASAERRLCTDKEPVLAGVYQTWDDVISHWIGQQKVDLYYELGPPQFNKEAQDGMEELVWDMTLPSLLGQAEI